jgi:hypothetical protein
MSGPATDAKPSPSGSDRRPAAVCRRRRGWRWLVAGALVLGVFLARGPLLRGLAGLLIAEGPDRAVAGVVPVRGDRMHDAAAARVRDGATEVLLIERVPLRHEALGVIPVRTEIDRRALEARGAPAPAIRVLSEQTLDDWDGARVLRDWLRDRPEAHVAVLCDRFGSRRQRIILDRVLGPDAARVHVVALPDRRYDETNWWRSKDGVAGWWEGLVTLGYVWLAGEGDKP